MTASRTIWRMLDLAGSGVRDAVLKAFGKQRVKLGDWPDPGLVEAAMNAIQDLGGERLPAPDLACMVFDIENLYFRVQGRRIRLCIEEYGEVSLWGDKRVVTELAGRIRSRLAVSR